MDLDLTLPLRGRPPKPVQGEIVRQLNEADLQLLSADRGVQAPPLKRIRDGHHAIARLLAQGTLSISEICQATGYSASRISILKGDPAFQELLSFYQENKLEAVADSDIDAASKLNALRNDAIDELQQRIEESPERINNDQLLDIVKATSDRTGLGPQSKSVNLNVNIDLAARMKSAREKAAKLAAGVADAPALDGGAGSQTVQALAPPEGET